MSLSLVSATVINTMTKSILWEERVYSAYRLKSVIEGSQDRNPKQEPRCRNWVRDHGGAMLAALCPLTCLATFLIQPRLTCCGDGTAHSGSDLSA